MIPGTSAALAADGDAGGILRFAFPAAFQPLAWVGSRRRGSDGVGCDGGALITMPTLLQYELSTVCPHVRYLPSTDAKRGRQPVATFDGVAVTGRWVQQGTRPWPSRLATPASWNPASARNAEECCG